MLFDPAEMVASARECASKSAAPGGDGWPAPPGQRAVASQICSDPQCHAPLEWCADNNGLACGRCGLCARAVPCDSQEWRCFGDDSKAVRDAKTRAERDDSELRQALCTIGERDVRDERVRRAAHNRLNQTLVWLRWLRAPCAPGQLALSDDEATTFSAVARNACLTWAREVEREREGRALTSDADDEETQDRTFGSPCFWAIAIALGVVARRAGGFNVQTSAMAARFTMDALHERLGAHRSESVVTHEGAGARGVDGTVRRRARFDSLGDDAARRRKLQRLNGLIKRSRVWGEEGGDPYEIGLAKPVLQCEPPGLLPRALGRWSFFH